MSAVFGYGSLIWKVSLSPHLLAALARPPLTFSPGAESALATRLYARVHQGAR